MKSKSKKHRWTDSAQRRKYMTWRTVVFQLNKGKYGMSKYYVCQKCKKKRKTTRTMHAHHEYSWHAFPDKRYDRQNGVVMCVKCHSAFHKKYKYDAIQDPKYLNEYLKR